MRTMCMCTGCYNLRYAAAVVSGVRHDKGPLNLSHQLGQLGRVLNIIEAAQEGRHRPLRRDEIDTFWRIQEIIDGMLQREGYMVAGNSKGDR